MKSNKTLALLLILSFVGIYYFIEKPEVAKRESENQFLNFVNKNSEVVNIETQNMQWEKIEGQWRDRQNQIPLSKKLISEFLGKFKKLKILKKIDNEKVDNLLSFIPYKANSIKFIHSDKSINEYLLGNHLGFSEEFYFQEKKGKMVPLRIISIENGKPSYH